MKMARMISPLYKRCAAIVLVLTLLLGIIPLASAQTYYASDFAVVYNNTYCNLRSQPSQNSTRLGSYNSGTWVQVTGESGNWYAVNGPDGKSGYMSKTYVTKGPTETTTVGIVANPNASSFLNLRKTASYDAKVLGIYYNGTPVTLLSSNNGWYHVRVDGVEGYMRQEYLERRSMVASDSVATIVTPNNSGLNMRQGPGKQYDSMRQFSGGNYVMVLAKGGSWWKVSIDGYVGFMSTEFLKDGILSPSGGTGGGGGGSGSGGGGSTTTSDGYGIINNPRSTQLLNLRLLPNTTSKVLGQFKNGTQVTIVGQGSEWCQVIVDKTGTLGYMMTKYLTLYNLPSVPTMTISHPDKTFVNLRNSPALSGNKIVTRMSHGDQVEVLAPGGDWYKIKYNGYTGYAVSYFMK